MAITPAEAGKMTQDEAPLLLEAEKKIDEILRQRYQGKGSVEITEPLERLNERSRRVLLDRFRAVGWNIEKKHYEADSHDPRERTYDAWAFTAGPSGNGRVDGFKTDSWMD